MKRVKLFKVVIEDLMVADSAEFYEEMHMPMLSEVRVQGSGEMAYSPTGKKITIPIRRHARRTKLSREYLELCGKEYDFEHIENGYITEETYIAIDPAAERVLRVELNRIESLESNAVRGKEQIVALHEKIRLSTIVYDSICGAGFFQRFKWLFSGVT